MNLSTTSEHAALDSERRFTIVIGYINIVTIMSVNVNTVLNTAPNSVSKGRHVNLKSCFTARYLFTILFLA